MTAIIGLAIGICIVIALLPMTASAELYAANGNPFTGNADSPPFEKDPGTIPVDPPTLDPGTLPVPDPIALPTDPKPAEGLKKESFSVQTVTGVLYRVAAIGGETTGWAIRLNSPLRVSATMQVNKIEVDDDSSLLEPLLDKRVDARGRITWRQGIERGRYPVMMLEAIQELQ